METAVVTPVKRKDKVNCSVTFLPDKKKATRANGIEDLEELNWKDYCNSREEFEVMLNRTKKNLQRGEQQR
jgi:hypothetical protein